MKIGGKVWVVTGGASGMGRELVLQLLAGGAKVAAVDIREEGLHETAQLVQAGDRLSIHLVDITKRDATESVGADVVAAHEVVDGLINNAGIIQPFVDIAELDYGTIQRVLDVNLMGTIHMVKAFLPVLIERPQAHIANVSSMGGYFPFPGQTMYGASKAAAKQFTEGLYAELLSTSVGVSVILPGAVRTSIAENSGVTAPAAEAGRLPITSADEAARIMIAGIEKGRLHIFVGTDARLLSLAIRIAPRRAICLIQRQMRRHLAASEGLRGNPVKRRRSFARRLPTADRRAVEGPGKPL